VAGAGDDNHMTVPRVSRRAAERLEYDYERAWFCDGWHTEFCHGPFQMGECEWLLK